MALGRADRIDLWLPLGWREGESKQREQWDYSRNLPRGEVVSNFTIVLMKWMNGFWTAASSEDALSTRKWLLSPHPQRQAWSPETPGRWHFLGLSLAVEIALLKLR